MKTVFTEMFGLRLPILMAPMFLVSNESMMTEAMRLGIAGAFPTLNYRDENELSAVLKRLNKEKETKAFAGVYGVNLIVQKTNVWYEKHLRICIENKVPFYITSLGSPKETIEEAHRYGAKVFCDVTNVMHARKCADMNCDGFIAVCAGAGGHAGPYPLHILVPALKRDFPNIPVLAAGGIADGRGILIALAAGAEGVSIGTRFIASNEAQVNKTYKDAVVHAGMDDIVMTERLSGTPSSVINTDAVKRMGLHQNSLERFLNKNKRTKKYFKMLVQWKGMKMLEKAIMPGNYQTVWSAGQSAEFIYSVDSCETILQRFEEELKVCFEELEEKMN